VEEEVEVMGEEDLEEHSVVEESIDSARREEEEVLRVVQDLFESLCEDGVSARLRAKSKGMKQGRADGSAAGAAAQGPKILEAPNFRFGTWNQAA
jgi:hypothetical protein